MFTSTISKLGAAAAKKLLSSVHRAIWHQMWMLARQLLSRQALPSFRSDIPVETCNRNNFHDQYYPASIILFMSQH